MRPAFVLALFGVLSGMALLPASPAIAQSRAAHTATANHATAATAPTAPGSATVHAPDGVVNVNTANESELVRLPGIGPSRAAAIVALRTRVQHFRSVDDLVRVRGIGHASLRRLRPYLTLTGETTLAERPGRTRPTHAPTAVTRGATGEGESETN